MSRILKRAFADFLAVFARAVVRKYKPTVVMITGSVGKTSTKDAVAVALTPYLYVRKSEKSYNSEFGVPLTIFGVGNPWHSLPGWLLVLKGALTLIFLPNHYPRVLVMEVGADRPGDLAKILWIATPDMVVLTPLPEVPVHVEAYSTPEAVREEEFAPAYALAPGAPLIIPADDGRARKMAMRTASRVLSYGTALDADVRVVGVNFYEENGVVAGMAANIIAKGGGRGTVIVRGSVGAQQVLPPAAAVAAAEALSISFSDALAGLASYEPPPGRGSIFKGKDGATIIDDSYNSSPIAVEEALKTLRAYGRLPSNS